MSLTSNLRQFQSAARLEQILGSVHDTNNDFLGPQLSSVMRKSNIRSELLIF